MLAINTYSTLFPPIGATDVKKEDAIIKDIIIKLDKWLADGRNEIHLFKQIPANRGFIAGMESSCEISIK